MGHTLDLLVGHAVHATQVAGIREGYPQVIVYTFEAIGEHVVVVRVLETKTSAAKFLTFGGLGRFLSRY